MKEKYIRYLADCDRYLISIITRKYTLFSKRVKTLEEAIQTRNKFLMDRFGNLEALERKNVPKQFKPNEFFLSEDGKYYTVKDSKGNEFLVDADDYSKISKYTWYLNQSGYIENQKMGKLHRFLLNAPDGEEVDHINRNKLDNRKSNLRIVDCSINRQNRGKLKNKTVCNYKGVYIDRKTNKYYAVVVKNRKNYYSKMFDLEEDAAMAYNKIAVSLYGKNAFQNVIQN